MESRKKAFAPLEELIEKSSDEELNPEVKKKLAEKVDEAKEKLSPLYTDKWIYRYVVAFLGLAILASLFFTFFLAIQSANPQEAKIPDIFLAIGSAAVGALAGLLAPSPGRSGNE
ncbi:MAG: hypothetical protein P8184_15600 [Calditrichia bacterium]